MNGIQFAEVRDALAGAFDGDQFDMFLFERLEFNRPVHVAEGPFLVVVSNVLKQAMQQGWDALLIAEAAAARPLKKPVQEIYKKYAQELIDEARRQAVEDNCLKALERFGLTPRVKLQRGGAMLTAATYGDSLEKTIKRHLQMLDVGLWRERLFKLESRVCRVEVGNGEMGTGFLVGPDTLLTNYHVLQAVIENKSAPAKVRCRFDYRVLSDGKETEGVCVGLHAADWLISQSKFAPAEAKGTPDQAMPTFDELDYALVRLERTFGLEPFNAANKQSPSRGWIETPTEQQPLMPKAPILILQHPNTEPLKLAIDTEGVLELNGNGTRVRYATNTEGGSSGSPCFDMKWNLVALHHYGDPAYNHAPRYNQGVPIQMIREHLKRKNKEAALGGVSP